MTKTLEELVEISGSAWYNILRNVIEVPNREAFGDLIGKKYRNRFIITNAYPFQTSRTTLNSAGHGNDSARERLRDMDKIIRNVGSRFYIMGQYHSHIYTSNDKRVSGPSKDDKNFFLNEMDFLGLEESIQIIAHVKRNQNNSRIIGESMTEYPKMLRVIFRDDHSSYDIFLGAYKLSESKLEKLKIMRRRVKVTKRN